MDKAARQEVIVAWPVDERRRLRPAEGSNLHLRKGESGLAELVELGKVGASLNDVDLGVCTDVCEAKLVHLAEQRSALGEGQPREGGVGRLGGGGPYRVGVADPHAEVWFLKRVQAVVRRARRDDQPVITALVRRARLNPAGLHWEQFVIGNVTAARSASPRCRRHSDGAKELASLVVEPGARGHGIATQMVDVLLADETAAVYTLIDRRFAGHFARWGFRQVGPSELPRSVFRTYMIGRAVTTLGSLLRWQRIRIVPLLRQAR